MIRCANCKYSNYILSDCKKYIKCNNCNEIYNTKCNHCNSFNLGLTDGGDQQCKNCGIKTAIWEFISYDKPKFNGVYDKNNKSQLLFDTLEQIHQNMNKELTLLDKIKIFLRNLFYSNNDCRRFL
mgnify:CR=1 FL=1|tara:strand:- start:487 stop:861 length:375 start_codon:yes stop_codon:yes gene_type:complete